ncbi:uncharacterized protein LOC114354414 [Ostrinia furnacalis]|uniref:uncharacterized protein LOC114354414 n=1 Tax=Ostrinia furnacalis TaxID=93504 RepID=UPI00103EE373|nr:uncharacterized protein LOC114354414 [Ostrinia furnacalis]
MSKKEIPQTHNPSSLQELRIDNLNKPRRHSMQPPMLEKGRLPKVSSKSNDFVYVNTAYAGSLSSVRENPTPVAPTSVIREQYWACSKWPHTQRILAITVGVLVGAVIGLAITIVLTGKEPDDLMNNIFQTRSAPD